MSLMAALVLAQSAVAAPPVPNEGATDEDITVIAQRLRGVQVGVTRDAAGKYHCGLSESTGVRKLDAALCKATTQCVRKGKASQDEVRACVDKARPSLVARIREYLSTERAGGGA
ncbi:MULTISPECIES: hypothetical protein [unclassified Sphingobium]|uniref:hypothetical protein n=1 Tax=unclassified Sphingobium TaxID=2611147 RepID=UPI0022250837|nr:MULTISPECIES: hypothetical protein [unclassified Sphingobium]MCW2410699.1 hypothetical protein [Sphingobium sp. B8D3D]MCW2417012.1 hypothetical protein [Sphingobium sp. B8D3A]